MKIMGLQKTSMLDFPDTIAATVFTSGCNLLCPFCHNPSLVIENDNAGSLIDENEVIDYLEKRSKLLGGVCISGGEPLLQNDLTQFIERVKRIGLKVKLDTNGCFPEKLKLLLEKNLLDYVAMDIKNSPVSYPTTVGVSSFNVSLITKSAEILRRSKVDYEFRTTLIKELHKTKDLEAIGEWLTTDVKYYLQNFEKKDVIINDFTLALPALTPYSPDELENAKKILKKYFTYVSIRGV